MSLEGHHHHLKRELGLAEATFYGLGIIIGAGIFVLLGDAAGIAGNSVWLSFLIAAAIAALTGLSYCELSSRFPHESAEYLYTKKAFHSELLSFLIGWILILTAAFAVSTVAMGFASYLSEFFSAPAILVALVIIAILSFVNFRGIKSSAEVSIMFSLTEIAALVIIILASIPFIGSVDYFSTPSGSLPAGLGGVAAAASLVFFAFIGFDTIPKISEETRRASKTIPKALVYSLLISTVFYVLVAVSTVSVVPWQELGSSSTPLADVASRAAGPLWSSIISVLALFATFSTVLVLLIAGSRMIYGMSEANAIPRLFSFIHRKRNTPHKAIFTMMLLSMVFVCAGNIPMLASMTTIGMFIVFIFVNASLIAVRANQGRPAPFVVPLNAGKIPVLAILGLLTSAALALQFEPLIYVFEAVVVLAGFVAYGIFKLGRRRSKHSFIYRFRPR